VDDGDDARAPLGPPRGRGRRGPSGGTLRHDVGTVRHDVVTVPDPSANVPDAATIHDATSDAATIHDATFVPAVQRLWVPNGVGASARQPRLRRQPVH